MKILFGIWTMAVALTVSVVAAYYSIVGLTAIFAAAVIPVIIMGATLEVAKVTAAVYLHSFWNDTGFLTKAYLTCAVVVLMFITSMGIFGFLSKAHIEQQAGSGSLVAQVERLDQEILREQQTIERANTAIDSFGERVSEADTSIEARITSQERIISDISSRLERDISTQNQIIRQSNNLLGPLQADLERVEERRTQLRAAQASGDVPALQALVGANPDGVLGPATRTRIAEFERELDDRRAEILAQLERLGNTDDPAVSAARAEITRLQQTANAEIARAQEAINSFREQLISVTTVDNTAAIAAQNAEISAANQRIDEILTRKFELEAELRVLEVEVGPVRYVAELVYGETNTELLEQAVRWVIIVIVMVFDPLALVLVLAGLSILHKQPIDNKPEPPYNEKVTGDDEPPAEDVDTQDTNLPELEPGVEKPDPASSPSITALEAAEKLSEAQRDNISSASQSETQVAHVPAPSVTPPQRTAKLGQVLVDGRNYKFNRISNEK